MFGYASILHNLACSLDAGADTASNATHAIQHMQYNTRAIQETWGAWGIQHMQYKTHTIQHTCNTTHAIKDTCNTTHAIQHTDASQQAQKAHRQKTSSIHTETRSDRHTRNCGRRQPDRPSTYHRMAPSIRHYQHTCRGAHMFQLAL